MTQAPTLATFAELRRFAETSPVAHACIELRAMEIASTGWDIGPEPALARAIQGHHSLMADFAERRARAVRFFRQPDPNYASFTSWLRDAMRETFTDDALAIYLHPPKRPGAGALPGSNVAALGILDGALIEPVLSANGKTAGYAQHSIAVQRRTTVEMITSPLSGAPEALYGCAQMEYPVFSLRPGTPFGYSPLEEALTCDDDGGIDMAATEAELPATFGLPLDAPGISTLPGAPEVASDRQKWLHDRLHWLAGFFNGLLEGSGMRWQWEGLD